MSICISYKIEDSKGIDFDKTDKSKECKIFHYSYFNNGLKSHSRACNYCDRVIKSNRSFAIINANGVDYRFFVFDVTEEDAIGFIKNFEPDEL